MDKKNAVRCAGVGLTVLSVLAGCSTSYKVVPPAEEHETASEEKVTVEAYLFDARLKRQGKPTSFRLEIFHTDSMAALGGRAYLGKGALKGVLTVDSLQVYFPSSNEYVYESVSDLFASAECTQVASALDLLSLFQTLPDSITDRGNFVVAADYSDTDRPEFDISLENCPWQIELTYDRRDENWRIRSFNFDNGKDITLRARRREYKSQADVPVNKFRVPVPADAARIIP